MLDFRDRAAQRRQPRLLLQRAVDFALHRRQLAFRDADLVAPRARRNDARRIFRVLAEATIARVIAAIGRTSTK